MKSRGIITVFGSHSPQPGSDEYILSENIGREIKNAGFTAATGGYGGIMEGVLKGAGGGIGYTADIFSAEANSYVTEEIKSHSLFSRIEIMIHQSAAFIIMKGGTGTLLELAAVWEMVNKKMTTFKPVVCIGKFWRAVIESLSAEPTIDNLSSLKHLDITASNYISLAETPVQCIQMIEAAINSNQ